MKTFDVVCGIIFHLDQILIARRKQGKSLAGKWEFPGGKVELTETEQQALKRELMEEFGMQVVILNKLGSNLHRYDDFTICLIAYKCEFIKATFELTDHDSYKWVVPTQLKNYDMADADIPLFYLI
jgi:8-oxo-dGTP diphosphatase